MTCGRATRSFIRDPARHLFNISNDQSGATT